MLRLGFLRMRIVGRLFRLLRLGFKFLLYLEQLLLYAQLLQGFSLLLLTLGEFILCHLARQFLKAFTRSFFGCLLVCRLLRFAFKQTLNQRRRRP